MDDRIADMVYGDGALGSRGALRWLFTLDRGCFLRLGPSLCRP